MLEMYFETRSIEHDLEFNPMTRPKANGEILVGEDQKTESELHAAYNPTDKNNIIVGVMDLDITSSEFLDFSIYMTKDFGDTWTKSDFTAITPGRSSLGGGDPVIVFDPEGNAYFTWLFIEADASGESDISWGIYAAKSEDGGLTWSDLDEPIAIDTASSFFQLERLTDKQWLVSDLNESSPYYGNIYCTYATITPNLLGADYEIIATKKERGQVNFDTLSQVVSAEHGFCQFTSIDADNNGHVYISYTAGNLTNPQELELYIIKSTDGGASYSTPQLVTNFYFPDENEDQFIVEGLDATRLYPCPHLAIDKSDTSTEGNIYISYTASGVDSSSTLGLDIYMVKSDDGGTSWSSPQVINNNDNPDLHQYYSAIEVDDFGDLFIAWYDRSDDINNQLTHYFIAESNDGGETFVKGPVTSEATDFRFAGQANGNFSIGEYNSLITIDDYVIPFWSDGRTGDGSLSVYAHFLRKGDLISSTAHEVSLINEKISLSGPFPNPVQDRAEFTLDLEKGLTTEVQVVNVAGQVIYSSPKQQLNSGRTPISFSVEGWNTGIYFFNLKTQIGNITRKFTVK